MARKNKNISYITNDIERKAAYENGKRSIIEEVGELSTLFDVEACAIIFNEDDPNPEVWPSREGATNVLTRFNRLPESKKTENMISQESSVCQQINECPKELTRLLIENNQKAMTLYIYQCIAGLADIKQFDMKYASNMESVLHKIKRDIRLRIDARKNNNQHIDVDAASSSTYNAHAPIPSSDPMVMSNAQYSSLAEMHLHDHW